MLLERSPTPSPPALSFADLRRSYSDFPLIPADHPAVWVSGILMRIQAAGAGPATPLLHVSLPPDAGDENL